MPRIGCVPYLNALPLVEGLKESCGDPIVFQTPEKLHLLMVEGKLDVALLPVVSYLENPELKLVSGTGIVSRGEVKSVKAFHARSGIELDNSQSIFLDPHSKTSQKLLKVLLRKKYQRDLSKIHWAQQPELADSILEIGDNALEKCHFGNSTDLGLEWRELTGLPFVYACWMSRDHISPDILSAIHNAKMTGIQSIQEISLRQKRLPQEDVFEYLSQHIYYDINGPELVGLKLFFDWVMEMENQSYDTSLRFVA